MTDGVDINKMVKVFVKMRDKKAELAAEFKAADDAIQVQMDAVKRALLDYCKENGVESARTEAGMFYRTVRSKYWTNDWGQMGAFRPGPAAGVWARSLWNTSAQTCWRSAFTKGTCRRSCRRTPTCDQRV